MEWWMVAVIALVVFGGSQIPKMARNIGRAQSEFKQGLKEGAETEASETAEKA